MKSSHINEAVEIASTSEVYCASHGAVVILRGKIIGRGCNRYSIRSYKQNVYSVHAEVAAIEDALRKTSLDSLRKSKLIIVRVNNFGEIKYSYPCEACKKFINNWGIKSVYYS